jgi:hypothetical protein
MKTSWMIIFGFKRKINGNIFLISEKTRGAMKLKSFGKSDNLPRGYLQVGRMI